MQDTIVKFDWDSTTEKKYKQMIEKIPLFHREIARQVVDKKAVVNAQARGSKIVQEEDVIRAFLTEVPKAFYSLLIRLLDEAGWEHDKYEAMK